MIVIVGGGVMGVTLAYTLARRGAAVTLLERGHIGAGASGVPVALLNPYRGRSARASAFDLKALEAMWALVGDLEAQGYTTGVVQSGVLRAASNAKQAKQWQKRDGVTWFSADEAPIRISRTVRRLRRAVRRVAKTAAVVGGAGGSCA